MSTRAAADRPASGTRVGLPARVRALVALVVLTGLLLGASATAQLVRGPSVPLPVWLPVVALIVLGDVPLLRLPWRGDGNSTTWVEASVVVAVALVGWPGLIAALGPVVLLRQLAVRRALHKAAYNAATAVIAASLAQVAYQIVAGRAADVPRPLTLRAVAGLSAAALVLLLTVSVLVACAVSTAQGLAFGGVWRRGAGLRVVIGLTNVVVGLGAVLVGAWSRPTLVVLPFLVLGLHLAFNEALRNQQERDIWRQVHRAPGELSLDEVGLSGVDAAVRRRTQLLFGASDACVLLDDVDPGDDDLAAVRAQAAAGASYLLAGSAPAAAAAELSARGLAAVLLTPLETGGQHEGVLLVGFAEPTRLRRRERQVLRTFADQTAVSVQHARLFEALEEQRGRLSSVVDNASDGILLVDRHGAVRTWNDAMARLTGTAAGDAVGRRLEQVLPGRLPGGEALSAPALLLHSETRGDAELSGRVTGAAGDSRELSMSVARVRSPDTGSAVVVARDVTAKVELEQAKEDFLATVSHELRTPLTPIKGYLKMLQRPALWDDAVRRHEVLTILADQAGQLERLVEDLLTVSRMTRGQFGVELQIADVDEVVARAVRDAGVTGTHVLHHRRAGSPALARCDPARLQQVVANLLSNAQKYSPAGTRVQVDVAVGGPGGEVEVRVVDEGAGVPAESRELVFEPFRRLGDHQTRSTRGTGLGLHIARQLVQAMHGRVWVDGAAGEGARFHVALPVAAPGAGQRRPAAGRPPASPRPAAPRNEPALPVAAARRV